MSRRIYHVRVIADSDRTARTFRGTEWEAAMALVPGTCFGWGRTRVEAMIMADREAERFRRLFPERYCV